MISKLIFALFAFLSFTIFSTLVFSAITITCDQCVPNNCQCETSCESGTLRVYSDSVCSTIPSYSAVIGNGQITWFPPVASIYYLKVFCSDAEEISRCLKLTVSGIPGESFIEDTVTDETTTIPITTITTTPTRQTRTTTATTRQDNGSSFFSFNSINSILIVAAVLAFAVVAIVFAINFLRKSGEEREQYEALKQKWGR